MFSEEDIKTRLRQAGYQDDEIAGVIFDVMQIVVSKAMGSYISELPDYEQEKLRGMRGEEILLYIEANKGAAPKFSKEDFIKIYQETWEDYFAKVSSK